MLRKGKGSIVNIGSVAGVRDKRCGLCFLQRLEVCGARLFAQRGPAVCQTGHPLERADARPDEHADGSATVTGPGRRIPRGFSGRNDGQAGPTVPHGPYGRGMGCGVHGPMVGQRRIQVRYFSRNHGRWRHFSPHRLTSSALRSTTGDRSWVILRIGSGKALWSPRRPQWDSCPLGTHRPNPRNSRSAACCPLSGPYGLLGEDMRRGVQIAVEERGGKVLGVPVEINWEDDETKPQPAVQKATKLISEGSHMIFGALSSASTLAVMNLTKQRKIPHLVTISADDKITVPGGSRYTFRTSNNLGMENRMALAYMQDRKLKKIYIVTADYQATRDGYEWIKSQVGSSGIQIVGEDFPPLGNRDYSSIVDKIAKSDADGVLLMLTGSDVVTLLKQAGQVNLGKNKLLFGPVAADETMAAAVGPASLGVNSGLRYDHSIDTAANRKFVEAYRKKFGIFPSMTAGEAYDGMAWWLDTVEKTGSWDKEKWVDAFATNVRENSVEGRKTMRACDHQALQPGFWGEVVQGTPARHPP